jgi:hypothetical protein
VPILDAKKKEHYHKRQQVTTKLFRGMLGIPPSFARGLARHLSFLIGCASLRMLVRLLLHANVAVSSTFSVAP